MTAVAPNQPLAATARETASRAPGGSLDRRVYGVLAVALGTTRTIAAARKALSDVRPDDVRAAALTALDDLARQVAAP